jgi:hypothetical protein
MLALSYSYIQGVDWGSKVRVNSGIRMEVAVFYEKGWLGFCTGIVVKGTPESLNSQLATGGAKSRSVRTA